MRRHLGARTLAGFRQGDLSPRRSARIHAHLAGCARCSDLNSDLDGVTTLLAAARPPPIPEHLAARIQSALATEAARRVAETRADGTGTEGPGTVQAGPALPPDGRSRRQERPGHARKRPRLAGLSSPLALRVAAAAAAAVVIAGGTYEIVQHVGGSPNSGAAASGAPGRARSAGPFVAAPSALPGLRYQHAGHQEIITPIPASVNLTPANLRSEVSNELSRHSAARTNAVPAQPAPASGLSAGSALEGCVSRIAARQQVLLVVIGRYLNAPATVIVTSASGTSPEQVWVVGAGCSQARSDVLAHVTLPPGG